MKHFRLIFLAASVLLAMCSGPDSAAARKAMAGGLRTVLGTSAEPGTLFDYYEPKGLAKRSSNWTAPLDLTGVSWNDTRTCTLISRQHVVMAAHYIRPSTVPVMFHDRSGNPHERYIISVKSLAPQHDVAIAKLNLPLPAGVKHYDLAAAAHVLPGTDVLITDQTKKVSIHQVSSRQAGGRIGFTYDPALPATLKRNLVVGDSGNPSFIVVGGDLKLLETHTFGGPGSGPDYSDSALQSTIKAMLQYW